MKRFSVLVCCMLTLGFVSASIVGDAFSQTTAPADAWKSVKLGPMFMPGLSSNVGSVANGTKTDAVKFSWALGAVADFPFSSNTGLQLGVCYDSRSVGFHDQKTADTSVNYTFTYFSLRPEFRIGYFLIGLGIGVPIGESADAQKILAPSLGASGMNMLIEGHIGATLPVVQADNGNELRFLIDASYAFSQITTNPLVPNDNTKNKTDNNGPIAALQLGFAYLFNLNQR